LLRLLGRRCDAGHRFVAGAGAVSLVDAGRAVYVDGVGGTGDLDTAGKIRYGFGLKIATTPARIERREEVAA
jgi:hypothetical protein